MLKKLKFVIAPDSYKESLSAFEAAEAMKSGLKKVFEDAEYELIPLADGGEGTSEVLVYSEKGEFRNIEVTGPLGDRLEAKYGLFQKEKKAIIEVASACGLHLVEDSKRNPLFTTTYGVGEMILDALDNGVVTLIIGLGGSSTNDGGLGMLQALGVKAFDREGYEVGFGGKELIKIARVDISNLDKRLCNVNIEVACDVENPLIGEKGATRTFGPQKGATEEIAEELENGMKNYAQVLSKDCKVELSNTPKSGAAGGLGGAFILLGAKLINGIELVLKHTKFEEKIIDSDYIFTGEGSIDGQTKFGKTLSGIASIAKRHNIPVIALGGKVGDDIEELYPMGITSVFGIIDKPKNLKEALKDGYSSIEKTSENVGRLLRCMH